MTYNRQAGVRRFKGRDIVIVPLIPYLSQAFYRSSGTASGMPGVWLPFDGCAAWGWFIKDRFVRRDDNGDKLPLHRFGSPVLKGISATLAAIHIPPSDREEFQTPKEVNAWLRYNYCLVPKEE